MTFTGNAKRFDVVTDARNAFAYDDMAVTSGAGTSVVVTAGSLTDTTPLLTGTISRALATGEVVQVFRAGVLLGNATIAVGSTNWTYTSATTAAGTYVYTAKLLNSSAVVVSTSSNFTLSIVATPLALDLNGDGVQTVGTQAGVLFDLDVDGKLDNVGWVNAQDGLLALDRNGDGKINNGSELFGQYMVKKDGTLAKDGFDALRDWDSNHDGVIDAQDAVYDALRVWVDANGDGITDAGELRTLASLGITSMGLDAVHHSVTQNGNILGDTASYTSADGTTKDLVDVWFKSQSVNVIQGSAEGEVLQGTAGNDYIVAAGGADRIDAAGGDDVVVLNAGNMAALASAETVAQVDGGSGANILKFTATDMVLDLTSPWVGAHLHNFGSLDLSGAGAQTLKIDLNTVLGLSGIQDVAGTVGVDESKMLVINGDAGDTLQLVAANQWSTVASHQSAANLTATYGSSFHFIDGHSYTQYNYAGVTLWVDEHLSIGNV
jgi:hypothetical protein